MRSSGRCARRTSSVCIERRVAPNSLIDALVKGQHKGGPHLGREVARVVVGDAHPAAGCGPGDLAHGAHKSDVGVGADREQAQRARRDRADSR